MRTQLTLPLCLRDDATFANFFNPSAQALLTALKQIAQGEGEGFLYLWGANGAGRSHLLQACCHAATAQNLMCMYLSFAEQKLSPTILQDMEMLSIVCIDDIDKIAGDRDWEEALQHFYNRARDSGTRLIVSSGVSPTNSPIQLPDLRSRLAWGLTFHIPILSDSDKIQALQCRAQQRGMTLSAEVGEFLLRHHTRDMSALMATLENLDEASLAAQRRLTIPFVKSVLER